MQNITGIYIMHREEFIFAFDDSGGIEPLLSNDRKFQKGQFPFFIIMAVGINKKFYYIFHEEWNALRERIRIELGCTLLPALHGRLMFGKSRPKSYRGSSNPFFHCTHEQSEKWFLEAVAIFTKYQSYQRGAGGYWVTYDRESLRSMETSLNTPVALEEGEFLKLAVDRRNFSHLHKKYIAHISAALVKPTLDILMVASEVMRQCGTTCEVKLDSYSDSSGFNDDTVSEFIITNLKLGNISTVSTILDTDNEPLCQAADLLAYSTFRSTLRNYRIKAGEHPPIESMTDKVNKMLIGKNLTVKDMNGWIARQRVAKHVQPFYSGAQYAAAYFEIHKYAPTFVEDSLKTPEEFLEFVLDIQDQPRMGYWPILKDGVLEAWQASQVPK